MKVWVVSEQYLDAGPDGSPDPVAVFSNLEAAEAFAEKLAAPYMGTKHWWGTVTDQSAVVSIEAFEVDKPEAKRG